MDYFDLIKNIQLPIHEQYKNFAEDLCAFHSWYKHLNLLKGNRFILFLNPDVAKGYNGKNPRMHYGWKTTEEYKSKYGFLDYMYDLEISKSNKRYYLSELNDDKIFLPEKIINNCSFILYPFVSTDFNAIESISYEFHQEDLKLINETSDYPCKDLVNDWSRLYNKQYEKWCDLSEEEQSRALEIENGNIKLMDVSNKVLGFIGTDRKLNQVYNILQEKEQGKIESALNHLKEILGSEIK